MYPCCQRLNLSSISKPYPDRRRFVVLFDFPGFMTLHQPPERYGTWFESDQVPWSDSRRPFSARSPLLFPGDLDGCPTRGVGRTPRYSITLWWLVRVRPAPPRSRL